MNIGTLSIYELLSSKILAWLHAAIVLLPNFAVATLIILSCVVLARLTNLGVCRFMQRTSESQAVTRLVQTLVRLAILTFGVFSALGILNLDKTVASLLAGAGVIGLAIGFAFQEIAANFFAGILIAFRKPFQEGDIVQIESFVGKVREITLRTTNIATYSGLEVLVPNKDMFTKPVINYTSTPLRRVEIDIGISYADDLEKVWRITTQALSQLEARNPDKPVEFFYTSFGDSAINGQARFWVNFPDQLPFVQATHDAIIAIKKAYDAEGISIPFPIRTLEWDRKLTQASPSAPTGGTIR